MPFILASLTLKEASFLVYMGVTNLPLCKHYYHLCSIHKYETIVEVCNGDKHTTSLQNKIFIKAVNIY
jgi:hypothetical protein